MLDSRGNNKDGGWAEKGEKRGGEEYLPPTGWIGYGLKVKNFYENDIWLGMNNKQGEWCVAFHGVVRGQSSEKVKKITCDIINHGFISSRVEAAENDIDLRHPSKICGHGVYCTPDINYIEKNDYAGIIEFNNEKYKCVLMLTISPEKITQSSKWPKEYILNPNE